jgi:hypothetical protein
MPDRSNDTRTLLAARIAMKEFLDNYEIHSSQDILDAADQVNQMLSDIWYIHNESVRITIMTFAIYDRWGVLV